MAPAGGIRAPSGTCSGFAAAVYSRMLISLASTTLFPP